MRLNVTLTGGENPYLALPLGGELEILEVSLDGRVLYAVFRVLRPDGTLSAPVQVRAPEFSYSPGVAAEIRDRLNLTRS